MCFWSVTSCPTITGGNQMKKQIYCPACGEQVEVTISDGKRFVRCPLCGEEVCTDYIPAYSDDEED